ncbi:ABC transporter ATP-binding protein [Helicobacter marmotae]|uniref:ABC transporter ATP-binding protein n=1 Tax=Helicobacter marmotae TaxID=152490 RepID=A0A3D8I3F4_9HELI|nr:ABC transporter ATP-binding protein [Helicobacter marmotae]
MNPLLRASHLSHSFETTLYKDVNLQVNEGESIAILGVSGSGKSTLLNNLSTLLPPKNGYVGILDYDNIYALSSKEQLLLRRLHIGIVFQSHYLFRGFNAMENLKVASLLSKEPIDHTLLESFGISGVLGQPIGELSGGQQQRLSIARVLTKKPKLIFADEPTGNLDKQTALHVMDILLAYIASHKAGLILATHDNDIASACNRTYQLSNMALQQVQV